MIQVTIYLTKFQKKKLRGAKYLTRKKKTEETLASAQSYFLSKESNGYNRRKKAED